MKLDRWKRIVLLSLFYCALLTSGFFSLRHGPYRATFGFIYYSLMLLIFWLLYRRNLKRRQPDTLIKLFPEPTESLKERP